MNAPTLTRLGLPFPKFFQPALANPELAGMVWMTREEEVASEARVYRETHSIKAALNDDADHGGSAIVVPVDAQTGFCADPNLMFNQTADGQTLPWEAQGGSLFVPGASGDVYRGCKFILDNLGLIAAIDPSLDTHRTYQIFHADLWRSTITGNPPPAYTVMTVDDLGVITGIHPNWTTDTYTTLFNQQMAVRYCQILAEQGSNPLTIWPYHCRVGSTHHPLMPLLSEIQMFHEITRRADDGVDIKGYQTFTESYGIVGDEVGIIDGVSVGEEIRAGYIEKLLRYKAVILWGEADAPFCVGTTVDQIAKHFRARDPELVKRLFVLTDCISPIPAIPGFENDPNSPLNFPAVAAKTHQRWASEGVNLVKSTDDFLAAALAA